MRLLTSTLEVVALAALVFPSGGCAAADHDFNSVVSGVEQHYDLHAQHVPMMGFVSLCARFATHGGVKGMRIAEFDHLSHQVDTAELLEIVRAELGSEWQPIVTSRENRSSELSVIYARPNGHAMRLLIASYEHGELDLVRMELDGSALARFIHDPREQAHHHVEYTPDHKQ